MYTGTCTVETLWKRIEKKKVVIMLIWCLAFMEGVSSVIALKHSERFFNVLKRPEILFF